MMLCECHGFQTDRRTDKHDKSNRVAFCNFAKAPKMQSTKLLRQYLERK